MIAAALRIDSGQNGRAVLSVSDTSWRATQERSPPAPEILAQEPDGVAQTRRGCKAQARAHTPAHTSA